MDYTQENNIFIPIRHKYEAMGVENYYQKYGNNYVNPHEMKINFALDKFLFNDENEWISQIDFSYILDLCCGSGEMTIYLQKYLSTIGMDNKKYKIDAIDPFTDAA